MLMQAIVDHLGRFMDVYIGWPGKVHDARVFVNSNLYRKAVAGSLFPDSRGNSVFVFHKILMLL